MQLLQVLARVHAIKARHVGPQDLEFLKTLYACARADELAATGWPLTQQQAFLAQQFDCQHRYYQEHYADAQRLLLLQAGQPIGRLYWRESPTEATLIDVSLMPEWRGQGIGSSLMRCLAEHADALGLSISLHVEPGNPARRLYGRWGFEAAADNGVYLKMCRAARQAEVPA